MERQGYIVSKYHLLAFALMTEFAHLVMNWSYNVKAGFGYQMAFNGVSVVAFAIFFCCISELTSALPFPGGSYAFTRCTVGFFPGYLVGSFEMVYYVLQFAYTNAAIVGCIRPLNETIYKNAFWLLLFMVISQVVFCLSKRVMYNFLVALAVFGVIVNCIYVFGGASQAHFSEWAYSPPHLTDDPMIVLIEDDDGSYQPTETSGFSGGGVLFAADGMRVLQSLAPCLWKYKGLEYVNLMCEDVDCPRTTIPFAQIIAFAIFALFITVMPVVGASMYPGAERLTMIGSSATPGLATILHLRHRLAVLVFLPVLYGNALVTLYSFAKLLSAMADSRLFPRFLSFRVRKTGTISSSTTGTPLNALLLAAIIAVAAVSIPLLVTERAIAIWSLVMNFFAFVTYVVQLVGYCVLQVKLQDLSRRFASPFGLGGAVFALVVFVFATLSTVLGPDRPVATLQVSAVFVIFLLMHYFCFAMHSQTFSPAEKRVMMPAHVGIRNANEYLYTKYPLLGTIVSCLHPQQRHRHPLPGQRRTPGARSSSTCCCRCFYNKIVPVDGSTPSSSVRPVWRMRNNGHEERENLLVQYRVNPLSSSSSSGGWYELRPTPESTESEDARLSPGSTLLQKVFEKQNGRQWTRAVTGTGTTTGPAAMELVGNKCAENVAASSTSSVLVNTGAELDEDQLLQLDTISTFGVLRSVNEEEIITDKN